MRAKSWAGNRASSETSSARPQLCGRCRVTAKAIGAESVGCGYGNGMHGCVGWQSLVNAGHISYHSCNADKFAPYFVQDVLFLIQVFTGILAVSLVALGAWYGVEDRRERRIIAVWSIDKHDTNI